MTVGLDIRPSAGLDIPFVPFTFPTVAFCREAKNLKYDLSWGEADAMYSAYSTGRRLDKIQSPGWTMSSIDYLKSQGFTEEQSVAWCETAFHFAKHVQWPYTKYFVDFGADAGGVGDAITGAISKAVETTVKVVTAPVRAMTDGLSNALGIPKWIMTTVVVLVVLIGVHFVAKIYIPGYNRLRISRGG